MTQEKSEMVLYELRCVLHNNGVRLVSEETLFVVEKPMDVFVSKNLIAYVREDGSASLGAEIG